MDSYQVALSWSLFGAAAVGCCYYYWPGQDSRGTRRREDPDHTRGRRMADQDGKQRLNKRSSELDLSNTTASKGGLQNGNASTRKRKVQTKEVASTQETPAVPVQSDDREETDNSTRAFAERMAQTQKGTTLSSNKSKEQRVKTVKAEQRDEHTCAFIRVIPIRG